MRHVSNYCKRILISRCKSPTFANVHHLRERFNFANRNILFIKILGLSIFLKDLFSLIGLLAKFVKLNTLHTAVATQYLVTAGHLAHLSAMPKGSFWTTWRWDVENIHMESSPVWSILNKGNKNLFLYNVYDQAKILEACTDKQGISDN